MTAVPCNGCVRCCRGDTVRILPHEDAAKWRTAAHPNMPGARMLDHKPNGDCVYLGDGGCTIHDDKPQQCSDMDCRNIARRVTWTKARKLDNQGILHMAVWQRGRELLMLESGRGREKLLLEDVRAWQAGRAEERAALAKNGIGASPKAGR